MDKKYFAKESFIPLNPCNTPADVLNFCKIEKIKYVDFKFMDFPGRWQHFTVPVTEIDETVFEKGLGFDGSSIRGWKTVEISDMLVVPDTNTVKIDPFCDLPTLSIICDIEDPITRERYNRDPRNIAKNVTDYLKHTGIGDSCFMGPEAEYFIFDNIRYDYSPQKGFFSIDSSEGIWNTGKKENPNLGYKIRYKRGYFPVPPIDSQQNLRSDMSEVMLRCGLNVECQHHEGATGGHAEIDLKFDELLKIADDLVMFKYIVKNVAFLNNKTVTFMPKPIFGDHGSGLHTHQSIWNKNKNIFAGDLYGGLSETALFYIGGILKHAKALNAFTNPSTNSYKRLVPGYEAPVHLVFSSRNRSASIRIPQYSQSPEAKRIEVRFPDPSCNPYLAFSAMLMAGIDGIQNKIHPGEPMDKNMYELHPDSLADIPTVCSSLDEALFSLENDHDFLLKGDVFTKDLIEAWINYKKINEIDAINQRPHPYEFMLYYDI